MKRLILTAGAVLATQGVWGQINYPSSNNGTPETIPDGSPIGYSESIAVSGLSGLVSDVAITLDVTGGFNGNLYAYLLSPDGQMAVLLNRVGLTGSNPIGYNGAGFNITLDGAMAGDSSADIHYYQTVFEYNLSGGTWAADGRNIAPNSGGAAIAGAERTAGLDIFNTMNASSLNGAWTLFIADLSSGGGTSASTLNSAILTITTVPEPQTWMMLGGGLATLLLLRRK